MFDPDLVKSDFGITNFFSPNFITLSLILRLNSMCRFA
jgi:hypothetical protein